MIRHIGRRLLLAIPTLLAVFTIIFIIVRVAPGDPAVAALGDYASADAVAALRERMGLNEPLWKQYLIFLGDLTRGDLGRSLISQKPVSEQIAFVLPYTLELTAAAIADRTRPRYSNRRDNRDSPQHRRGLCRANALAAGSLFSVVLSRHLAHVFRGKAGALPAVGSAPFSEPGRNLHYLVLPALTLGLIETAYIARMTRSVVLTILTDDYIRTARAKGLEEWVVLVKHALRAALIPIVSLVGIFAISLIGSSVLVEEVFARPGLGKLMVGATKQKDYTTLQSIMVVYALIIVIINLIVDIIYTYVDPRVRFS